MGVPHTCVGIVFEPLRNRQPPRPLPVCTLAKMISAPANGSGARLQIAGERQSGQDVRSQNVTAVSAIANIVKTSLGPVGLDKVCACMLRLAGMGSALSALAVWAFMQCMSTHASSPWVRHCHVLHLLHAQMLVDDIGEVGTLARWRWCQPYQRPMQQAPVAPANAIARMLFA